MYEVGELVKWRCPLDADYSYGYIVEIKRNLATVIGTGYYSGVTTEARTHKLLPHKHSGVTTEIHLRYIEKVKRGGGGYGRGKEHSKRSAP